MLLCVLAAALYAITRLTVGPRQGGDAKRARTALTDDDRGSLHDATTRPEPDGRRRRARDPLGGRRQHGPAGAAAARELPLGVGFAGANRGTAGGAAGRRHDHRPGVGRPLRGQPRLLRRPRARDLPLGVPARARRPPRRGLTRPPSRHRTGRGMDEIGSGTAQVDCDVLVIGGGTAGPMAAYKAKVKNPKARVILLEKANVKRSGAIAMGMDGLNNAVIPGYATPEQYTKEITIANDGICDQAPVFKYAERCFDIIQELDRFGIRFLKDENGDYNVKKVHHFGSYVLPMPNGDTVKKALY